MIKIQGYLSPSAPLTEENRGYVLFCPQTLAVWATFEGLPEEACREQIFSILEIPGNVRDEDGLRTLVERVKKTLLFLAGEFREVSLYGSKFNRLSDLGWEVLQELRSELLQDSRMLYASPPAEKWLDVTADPKAVAQAVDRAGGTARWAKDVVEDAAFLGSQVKLEDAIYYASSMMLAKELCQ